MTVAHHLPARTKYLCDICGAQDFWNDGWSAYSSMALDEACPDDMPTVCGEKCLAELNRRIEDGRIQPPTLRRLPGGFAVSKPGRGYPIVRAEA